MSGEQSKAIKKMADRIVDGYEAVHKKDFSHAKELLEPILPLFHQEDKPNIKLLCYVAIAQIGTKDIDTFLQTYEEIKKFQPTKEKEIALVKRIDEMFQELMDVMEIDNLDKRNE